MVIASLSMSSRAENIISLLSAWKDVLLILTLNFVSSCRSQSEASNGDASMRSRIALAVALPGVEESRVAVLQYPELQYIYFKS
jgi:hypothetical protein